MYGKERKEKDKSRSPSTEATTDRVDGSTDRHRATTPGKTRGRGGSLEQGQGEVVEDAVVFEDSGVQDEENDEKAGEQGEGSAGGRRQYEIDYLSDLTELRSRWQCSNNESLGVLWFRLLM